MHVLRLSYGVRGFARLNAYALRFAHMITDNAKDRLKILIFWEKHGLEATKEAFGAKRSTLYAWRQQLHKGGGKLEALNPGKTRPKTVRSRKAEWPLPVLQEIRRQREAHPNLGPEKVRIFLERFCEQRKLRCPKSRTVARLIHDLGGLRLFPEKVRHDGTIVRRTREEVPRKPKGFSAEYPGHLMTFDTIERFLHGTRRYILTCTDTYSRFSLALATTSHASRAAAEFFTFVRQLFPVPWTFVLSDNGSEFKKDFTDAIQREHLTHWKTYPKCPKMNAHDERFNRTIQEEFVDFHAGELLDVPQFNRTLLNHLLWHNGERPHWALGLKSPVQFLAENSPRLSSMWWRDTLPRQLAASPVCCG